MLNIKSSIFAVTALLYLCKNSRAVELLKKSKEFPGREIYFSDYSFKDALLVYAVCDNQVSDNERKCTINQEVSPYESVSRSCNVTMKSTYDDGKVSDLLVGAFNPDTAIIAWLEEGSKILAHIGAVDLNKCTVNTHYFLDDEENNPIVYWQFKNSRTIVRYKTFFDVFFKLLSCNDKECKVSINAEGNFINGPTEAMDRLPHYITQFDSIDSFSPDKGYAYKKFNEKDASYIMQKPDHTEKVLATSPENLMYDIVSTSNSKINIYLKTLGANGSSAGSMKLLQYDADGNNVLMTNLSDIGDSMQLENIYNLPEGHSILLLADIDERTSGCFKIKSFNLVKIDETGKKFGEIIMQGLDGKTFYETTTDRRWRYIWKNKQGGYCATIVGPTLKCTLIDTEMQNDLQIIENCFTDADFK